MQTVVTGGLGFIGSHVVERLVHSGEDTVVLDDSSSGHEKNIASCLCSPKLEVVIGDIGNAEVVNEALEGAETVIHLAAIVSVPKSVEDPGFVNRVNVDGTLNVLKACVKNKVKRLLFASTAAVYGVSRPPLKEDLVPIALSPYAASKIAGEAHCRAFSESYGLETVVLRLFNVYGPRSTGPYAGVMVKFAEAIKRGSPVVVFGDGKQTRDFVHVDDVVNAIVLAMRSDKAKGGIFNIGSGRSTTINHLAKLFLNPSGIDNESLLHKEPRKSEVRYSRAEISRARRILRYEPAVNLNSGVREYLSWFLGQ
ncbi:MAG: NAD-dependent epimerase/dehydratase family protein [Thaumarchaeota archaeon]|nr:NAD-dependent epimerase/dehydratase family protein [Nitrososphaerota archaeon]